MKISAVIAGAVALTATLTAANAGTDLVYTTLALKNGWVTQLTPPAIAIDSNNIVHFRGNMSQPPAMNGYAFIVPLKFRPNRLVTIPVIASGSTTSDLFITADGKASIVDPITGIGQAKPWTSLDGATYAKN